MLLCFSPANAAFLGEPVCSGTDVRRVAASCVLLFDLLMPLDTLSSSFAICLPASVLLELGDFSTPSIWAVAPLLAILLILADILARISSLFNVVLETLFCDTFRSTAC